MVIQATLKWGRYLLKHPVGFVLEGSAITLVGGSIYVHGGFRSVWDPFYRFKLDTRQWSRLLNGPEYRTRHTIVLVDDKIYIVGGRRGVRSLLPIEAYDLLTDESVELESFEAAAQAAIYHESLRKIIIVRQVPYPRGVIEVCSFHVETKRLENYVCSSGRPPPDNFKPSLVKCGEELFYLSMLRGSGRAHLYTLTLGRGLRARWSEIQVLGARLPFTSLRVFEALQGLLIIFGGDHSPTSTSRNGILFDPRTLEAVKIGPDHKPASLRFEGRWPERVVDAASVASNGKMWILGGKSSRNMVELELQRM